MVNKIDSMLVENIVNNNNELLSHKLTFSDSNATTSNQIKFYEIERSVNGSSFEYLDRVFTTDDTDTKVVIKDDNIPYLYYINFYDTDVDESYTYRYRVRTVIQDLYVGIYDLIKNFTENTDVDYVTNPAFLENFVRQYLSEDLVSVFLALENEEKDIRELVKKSKQLFSLKGLKESYVFFGRILLKLFLIKHVIRNSSFDDGDFEIYDESGAKITDFKAMLNSNIMSNNEIFVIDYSDFDKVEEVYLKEKLFLMVYNYLDSTYTESILSEPALTTTVYTTSLGNDITAQAVGTKLISGMFTDGNLTFNKVVGQNSTIIEQIEFTFTEPTIFMQEITFPALGVGETITVTYDKPCTFNILSTTQKSIVAYQNLFVYLYDRDAYSDRIAYMNNAEFMTDAMLESTKKDEFLKEYDKIMRGYMPQFQYEQSQLRNEFCYLLNVTGYIPAEEKANFYRILMGLLHPAGYKVTYQNVLYFNDYFYDRLDEFTPYDMTFDETYALTKNTRAFDSFDFLKRRWVIFGEEAVYGQDVIQEYPTLTETHYFQEGDRVQYDGSYYEAKYGFYTSEAFNPRDWTEIYPTNLVTQDTPYINKYQFGSELREYFDYQKTATAKTNGVCGTAHAKTYAYDDTTFDTDTFCSTGVVVSAPDFPTQGEIITWQCQEAVEGNRGIIADCYASRETTYDGICGTAERIFDILETGFGNYTFCTKGTVVSAPEFPTMGNTVTWECSGSVGGTSDSCSAGRNYAPVDGVCGTANRTFISEESFEGYTFCEHGTLSLNGTDPSVTEPTFPVAGTATWYCLGAFSGATVTCSAMNS